MQVAPDEVVGRVGPSGSGQANRLINGVAFYQAMRGGYAEDRETTSVSFDHQESVCQCRTGS